MSPIEKSLHEWLALTDAGLRLRCGEMTAQEIRTVRAVLKAIASTPEAQEKGCQTCRRCGGVLRPGIALDQTWVGHPDFHGDTGNEIGCTMTHGGAGAMIAVMKCEGCGHSVK